MPFESEPLNFAEILASIDAGQNLTSELAQFGLMSILQGDVDEKDLELFLLSLNQKGATHQEVTGFVKAMVPRGTVVIAGGTCEPDATSFTMTAELGSTNYGILENKYLAQNASTVEYKVDITLGEGEWSYAEDSVLKMAIQEDLLHHTDANTLTKVSD